jgi:N4-gp56 family major capsid protein
MANTLLSTASSGLSGQYQKYFSRQLLKHAEQLTVMDQPAYKVAFPANQGSKQIRFTKPDVADYTQVEDLTSAGEGVPTTNFRDYTFTFTDVTLNQYGIKSKISDVLKATDLFEQLKASVKVMGEDLALHFEHIILTRLVAGGVSGNKRYASGAANFGALSSSYLSFDDVLGACTKLRNNRAPTINGAYFMAVAPAVEYDLMRDPKFVVTSEYGTKDGMFKGEIGSWFGVKAVRTTHPWIESSEGTYSSGGSVYTSVVCGDQAYAVPQLKGSSAGSSELSPKVIIVDTPDKSDPLNQYVTAGAKAYWNCGVIDATWYMLVRSNSSFS